MQISKLLVVATHIYIRPELLLIALFRLLCFGGETLYVQGWLRYIRYEGNLVSGFLVFCLVSATAPNSLAQLLPGTYAHDLLVMHFHTKRRIFLLFSLYLFKAGFSLVLCLLCIINATSGFLWFTEAE